MYKSLLNLSNLIAIWTDHNEFGEMCNKVLIYDM